MEGRRELVGAFVGSGLLVGQAEAATSTYKAKCDKDGKCPPLVDELLAQTKANGQANTKMREVSSTDRFGSKTMSFKGNPKYADFVAENKAKGVADPYTALPAAKP